MGAVTDVGGPEPAYREHAATMITATANAMLGTQALGYRLEQGATMEREKAETTEARETPSTTRRALLLGGTAGLAGIAACTFAGATPAGAASGDDMVLGASNDAGSSETDITSSVDTCTLGAVNSGAGYAIQASDGAASTGVGAGGATGTNAAIFAQLNNPANYSAAVDATTAGTGNALLAQISNSASVSAAIEASTVGRGSALSAFTTGVGNAIYASIENADNTSAAIFAETDGTGSAVLAISEGSGPAITAQDNYTLIGKAVTPSLIYYGTGSGVVAQLGNPANDSAAVLASTAGTGNAVLAEITNTKNKSAAISGTTQSDRGIGVSGYSKSGIGVRAASTSGDALVVSGKVVFSTSGLATVATHKTSVTVALATVTSSSIVLATLQTDEGAIAVANAVPGSGEFTINLTAAPHAHSVKVAWFVIG
ncbi:MAG: hypothetical protein ACLQNG_09935 [Acidimicrobiales bacterium]|jgi:hypothetical protein